LAAAQARGRRGGRPRSLTEKDLAAAKALLSDPDITMDEVAKQLGVGPATLYRHLPGGRGAALLSPRHECVLDPAAARDPALNHFRAFISMWPAIPLTEYLG
jgi:AcrR family transcriptional regulator